MAKKIRRTIDRRRPERRHPESPIHCATRRSTVIQRSYTDRRSDPLWRFSWLRMLISQQLGGHPA